MIRVVAAGTALLAAPLVSVFGLVMLVAGAGSGSAAAAGHAAFSPSEEALAEIPASLLIVYIEAAGTCPGLPWQVLAGIGRIESNHGRFGGSTISSDGSATPPIIGIPLNGSDGTARIADTDNGRYDGDPVWDRAVGPMQFIPSSWAIFGVDGNDDGRRDPQNVYDAVPAAVRHLCPGGSVTDVEAALFSYNRSFGYVADVLDWASRYSGPLSSVGAVTEGYAYPLPPSFATEAVATRSHHDYPAIDVGTPVGTPAFAMVGGTVTSAIGNAGVYQPGGPGRCGNTVIISGADGATYTYCHLLAATVVPGQTVAAGQGIGLSGGEPDTPGAGNTSGPHLHLAVRAYGNAVCPQPLLLAISRGNPIPPGAAPTTGCYHPGPSTNWSAWLDSISSPDATTSNASEGD